MYGYGFGVYFLNQLLHYNVRAGFMVKFEELWGDRYADFELFNSVEKRSCVPVVSFGRRIYYLYSLVKEYIVNV